MSLASEVSSLVNLGESYSSTEAALDSGAFQVLQTLLKQGKNLHRTSSVQALIAASERRSMPSLLHLELHFRGAQGGPE